MPRYQQRYGRPRYTLFDRREAPRLAQQVSEAFRDLGQDIGTIQENLEGVVTELSREAAEANDILWEWDGRTTEQLSGNYVMCGSMNVAAAAPTVTTTTYEGKKWLRFATTDFRVASSSKVFDAWTIDWKLQPRFTVRFICKRRTNSGSGPPVLCWGVTSGMTSSYGLGWTLASNNTRIVWEAGASASAYTAGLLGGLALNTGDTDMQAVEMHVDLTQGILIDTSPTFLATSGASFDADVDSSAKGSHSYAAAWDGRFFDKFLIGLYGTSSTSTTFSIDITDFQIVKHPKDR